MYMWDSYLGIEGFGIYILELHKTIKRLADDRYCTHQSYPNSYLCKPILFFASLLKGHALPSLFSFCPIILKDITINL